MRLVRTVQQWPGPKVVFSVCNDDWTPAIREITSAIGEALPDVCFQHAIDFVGEDPNDEATTGRPDRDCNSTCQVVETYSGEDPERPCPEDPACPQAWCPPASADDPMPEPCRNPGTGEICEPFKRDLGICTRQECTGRRQCLLRQATRTYDGAARSCLPPTSDGWYYAPEGSPYSGCESTPCIAECPKVVLMGEAGPLIEEGSTAHLRCLAVL